MTEVPQPRGSAAERLTDGFNLVVDALALNGIQTIYGVVGIPITDLARIAQARGIRYIGFRHEAPAGHAAAAAGFLTQRPGGLYDRVVNPLALTCSGTPDMPSQGARCASRGAPQLTGTLRS